MRMLPVLVMGLLILVSGCQQKASPSSQNEGMEQVTGSHVTELEQSACSSADRSGTCDSKLATLGFITKEECCEKYGKCC